MSDDDIIKMIKDSIPPKSHEGVKEQVLKIIKDSSKPISRDSIFAIIELEHNIKIDSTLIKLIKDGKLEAIYNGKENEPLNIKNFLYELRQ